MAVRLYMCDREQCGACTYPECRHTSNRMHATDPGAGWWQYDLCGNLWQVTAEEQAEPQIRHDAGTVANKFD